ncbi:thioesterase family protein [Prauserella flavalba]|uniref:Acyl-CoA thioesterase n=1 Tax=Prauserella flavalba TaxID=1477506 RepID=A0A318LTT6_9PSEU|nr:thioesterase family protein [Prauserella flavalba]PXY35758.1 acyl-CoA thioesterase [Prauserella flavalba]
MGNFQEATALTRGPGADVFTVDLDPQWTVGGRMHGGYLLAAMARAATEVGPHAHPHAVSASFAVPPQAGPAQVSVEVLRAGNGLTQSRVRLDQDGTPCAEALLTLGPLADDEPYWSGVTPADLPPEHECVRVPAEAPGAGFRVDLMDVVEQRLDPRPLGFLGGTPSRRGEISGWQRLADGSDWDPLSLLVALDPVPPVSYDLGIPGWAPTLQFSAYLRRPPAPGPVRVRMRAGVVAGDRMDEIAEAWDSKDRLVAQATQLAGVRLPA